MSRPDHPREALSAYLDGELPADERGGIEAHLRDCPDCARLLSDLRQLAAAVREEEVPSIPAGLGDRVMSRLPAHPRSWLRRLPMAAAASVAAVTLLWIVWQQNAALRDPGSLRSLSPGQEALREGAPAPEGARGKASDAIGGTGLAGGSPDLRAQDEAAASPGREAHGFGQEGLRQDRLQEEGDLDPARRQEQVADALVVPPDDAASAGTPQPTISTDDALVDRLASLAYGVEGKSTTGTPTPEAAPSGPSEKKNEDPAASRTGEPRATPTERLDRAKARAQRVAAAPKSDAPPPPPATTAQSLSGFAEAPSEREAGATTDEEAPAASREPALAMSLLQREGDAPEGSLLLQATGISLRLAPDGSLSVQADGYSCAVGPPDDPEAKREVDDLLEDARLQETSQRPDDVGEADQRQQDAPLHRVGPDGETALIDDREEEGSTATLASRLRELVRERYGDALTKACGPPPPSLAPRN